MQTFFLFFLSFRLSKKAYTCIVHYFKTAVVNSGLSSALRKQKCGTRSWGGMAWWHTCCMIVTSVSEDDEKYAVARACGEAWVVWHTWCTENSLKVMWRETVAMREACIACKCDGVLWWRLRVHHDGVRDVNVTALLMKWYDTTVNEWEAEVCNTCKHALLWVEERLSPISLLGSWTAAEAPLNSPEIQETITKAWQERMNRKDDHPLSDYLKMHIMLCGPELGKVRGKTFINEPKVATNNQELTYLYFYLCYSTHTHTHTWMQTQCRGISEAPTSKQGTGIQYRHGIW